IKDGAPVNVSIPGIGANFTLPPSTSAPAPDPVPDKPLLSAAIDDYIRERNGIRHHDSELDVVNVLNIFLTLTGDLRIHLVNRDHVRDFEELEKVWPWNAKKVALFKGMTTAQILKAVNR